MEYTAAEQKKYKQAEIGTHTGICYMVATIGTQKTTYEGEEKEVSQIVIGWELPDELTDEGKRLSIIKTYTLSFNDKATLAKDYKAWTKETAPKTFKLDQLLGKGCNLAVGHTSGGNAKVIGVTALKASEKVPDLSVATILFDIREPNDVEFAKLPSFLKDKIAASPEYQEFLNQEQKAYAPDDQLSDPLPF